MSDAPTWMDRIMSIGEKKITEWVNTILTAKGCQASKELPLELRRKIEEIVSFVVSSLDLPTRKDLDEINQRLDTLNGKLVGLSLKVEKLAEREKAATAGARKGSKKKDDETST